MTSWGLRECAVDWDKRYAEETTRPRPRGRGRFPLKSNPQTASPREPSFSVLRGDHDHAVGAAGAPERGGAGVLQHLDALHVARAEPGERAAALRLDGYAVDYEER